MTTLIKHFVSVSCILKALMLVELMVARRDVMLDWLVEMMAAMLDSLAEMMVDLKAV